MILGAAEEAGVQLVALATPGDTFYELIVEPAADCVGQRSIAAGNVIAEVMTCAAPGKAWANGLNFPIGTETCGPNMNV